MHSTVTKCNCCRLLGITQFKYRNYENFKQQSNYPKIKLNKSFCLEQ